MFTKQKDKKQKEGTRYVEESKPDVCEFDQQMPGIYEPSSLRGFSLSDKRFLKEGKYLVSIIDNKEFDQQGNVWKLEENK